MNEMEKRLSHVIAGLFRREEGCTAPQIAKAVIAAMWEPTEEMIEMGKFASSLHGNKNADPGDVYHCMMIAIDGSRQ